MKKRIFFLAVLFTSSVLHAGSFSDRFIIERDDSGKLLSLKSKGIATKFNILKYVSQLEAELLELQDYLFKPAQIYQVAGLISSVSINRSHELINRFVDETEIGRNENSSDPRNTFASSVAADHDPYDYQYYMNKALSKLKYVNLERSFSQLEKHGVINVMNSKVSEYMRYLSLSIVANPTDSQFFYKRKVAAKVVSSVMKFAKKQFFSSSLLDLAFLVISDVNKRIIEQRIIAQNTLIYYLAHQENKTNLKPEEVDMVMSSIHESRIGIFSFAQSKKMGEKWRDYGWDSYDRFRRSAKSRVEKSEGITYTGSKKLVSVFYDAQLLDGQKVILNAGVQKHSFSGAPSISYYYDAPKKVKNRRAMLQLAQVGLGFMSFVPSSIKSYINDFASSWYREQSYVDSMLVAHFQTTKEDKKLDDIKLTISNPFFVY